MTPHQTTILGFFHLCALFREIIYGRPFVIVSGDANQSSINKLNNFGLINMINEATFYPTKSTLDVAYVSKDSYYSCKLIPPLGNANISYHLSYLLIPTVTNNFKIKPPFRRERTINYYKVKVELEQTDWSIFNHSLSNDFADACDSYI